MSYHVSFASDSFRLHRLKAPTSLSVSDDVTDGIPQYHGSSQYSQPNFYSTSTYASAAPSLNPNAYKGTHGMSRNISSTSSDSESSAYSQYSNSTAATSPGTAVGEMQSSFAHPSTETNQTGRGGAPKSRTR